MSIAAWIAKLGVNPTFIAQNAHCWFAFSLMTVLHLAFRAAPVMAFAVLALMLAAAKEFWFDAAYEVPKQTVEDGVVDFLGYGLGLTLGTLAMQWLA
jgi:hypothetical protein